MIRKFKTSSGGSLYFFKTDSGDLRIESSVYRDGKTRTEWATSLTPEQALELSVFLTGQDWGA